MDKSFAILDFDSQIFSFKVAKIIDDDLTEDKLREVLVLLKESGVKLVYWQVAKDDVTAVKAAESCGGFLADKKTTFVADLAIVTVEPVAEVREYEQQQPTNELKALAIQAGKYCRFKFDPKISEETFHAMYAAWITNSVNKEVAFEVLVVNQNNKIAGMITLEEKNNRGNIGLLAVNEEFRGQGIGGKLVQAAQHEFIARGYKESQVVTQLDNKPACRLYEKCGYHIFSIDYFWHFWV